MNPEPVDEQQPAASGNTLFRLGAIENHLDQIDARLATISEFNGRLDEIHTILETVIGFVTPDRILDSLTEPSTSVDDDSTTPGYRVVAHLSRDNGGTQLIPDVSWPDAWSVRLFVTALMRNLTRNNPPQQRRCWCEVWRPDETGEYVDSAILNPDTGAIEWESDILRRTEPS